MVKKQEQTTDKPENIKQRGPEYLRRIRPSIGRFFEGKKAESQIHGCGNG